MTERQNPASNYGDEARVEFVYDIDRVDVFDPKGEKIHEQYLDKKPFATAQRALEVYQDLGPGMYTSEDAPQVRSHRLILQGAAKRLPDSVMRAGTVELVGETEGDPLFFAYFGKIAICGRKPSEQEVADAEEAKKQQKVEEKRRLQARYHEKDKTKQDYSQYDHAFFTVGDKSYYLPLSQEAGRSFLAAHALNLTRTMGNGSDFTSEDFEKSLWNSLPSADRRLLCSESETYRDNPAPIRREVHFLINDLLRPLDIIDAKKLRRTDKALQLRFEMVPHATNYEGIATPIGTPGAPKSFFDALQNPLDFISHEELQALTQALQAHAFHNREWSSAEAIEVLDVIMTREGKFALQNLYPGHSKQDQIELADRLLRQLHKKAERTLDYHAYIAAKRQRTIAGNHISFGSSKGSPARLTGGYVSEANTKAEPLKRWSIGAPRTLRTFTPNE